tara:strand:- start:534 stop:950 length:417 start_codon:yes stop_codon:yes gene_type:complete
MTNPQYVNDIGSVYAQMYNPASEKVLEEKSKDHDYDIPKWARILHKHKQEEKFKQGPHCAHEDGHVDAEEENEENDLVRRYHDAVQKRKIHDSDYRGAAQSKLTELVGQISKLKADYNIEEGDPLFDQITQIEGIEIN